MAAYNSKYRTLWVRGPLGVGKSVVACYLIDLLRCQFSNSIIGYFFIQFRQSALSSARDITRALAYQCCLADETIYKTLKALEEREYGLDEVLEFETLFEILLLEPLNKTQKKVFIMIDGLDDVGWNVGASPSDIHKLLNRLAKLPSIHLLLISRPNSYIDSIIPDIPYKLIGIQETWHDSAIHVTGELAKSAKVQTFFQLEKVDPIEYFRERGHGVFLWVVLVIRLLSNSKTRSTFQKRLAMFASASGSIDALYVAILSTIQSPDRKLVQKIIGWLAVVEIRMKVSELAFAVDWTNPVIDFREFLTQNCGMIVDITNGNDEDDPLIHFFHESFREFVINEEKCPPDFVVRENLSHARVVLRYMKSLSSTPPRIGKYGLMNWTDHLSKATDPNTFPELFLHLKEFFHSEGANIWIRECIISKFSEAMLSASPMEINVESPYLHPIVQWMQLCQGDRRNDSQGTEQYQSAWMEVEKDVNDVIGDIFGKALVRFWIKGELNCFENLAYFILGLKYYWKRDGRTKTNLEEVEEMVQEEFKSMLEWSNGEWHANQRSLAMGYYVLHKWEECARLLSQEDAKDIEIQRYLAFAFMANRDYGNAIKTFTNIIHINNTSSYWYRPGLLEAYLANGDYDDAVKAFEDLANMYPENPFPKTALGYVYIAREDCNMAIEIFDGLPKEEWQLLGLYSAYMLNGDFKEGVKKLNAFDGTVWKKQCIAELYCADGDFNKAVDVYKTPYDTNHPLLFFIAGRLFGYVEMGDWDNAISEFEYAIDKKTRLSTIRLMAAALKSYKQTHQLARAIKAFEKGLNYLRRTDPIRGDWLWGLIEAYKANEDYRSAIKIFMSDFRERAAVSAPEHPPTLIWAVLGALLSSGDIVEGIRVVELAAKQMSFTYGSLVSHGVLNFLHASGNHELAIGIFSEAVEMHPMCSWLWERLSESYIMKLDYENAIKSLKSAIRQVSVNYFFRKRLGDAHLLNLNYKEAIETYNATIEVSPHKSLLRAYIRTHPTSPAEFRSNIAIKIDEDIFRRNFLWYSLGEALEANSDPQGAMKVYDAAIEGYQSALEATTRNDLFWQYTAPDIEWGLFDMFFRKSSLPESTLWAALGKAYECKGENVSALQAYQKALKGDEKNVWLLHVTEKLRMEQNVSIEDEFSEDEVDTYSSVDCRTGRIVLALRQIRNRKVLKYYSFKKSHSS